MNPIQYVSASEQRELEAMLLKNMKGAFDELTTRTSQWLDTPECREFYAARQGRISEFYQTSGIQEQWDNIIEAHCRTGMDISDYIYAYARKVANPNVQDFTQAERRIMNKLADNQYDLIRNVSNQEVQGIRRSLLEDYAEGVNPRQTSLKDIQLEPINGLSPEKRAEMIARTESATAINTATLEQLRQEGVEYVTLLCTNPCDDCAEYEGERVPIEEALNNPCIHPNCRCAWIVYRD